LSELPSIFTTSTLLGKMCRMQCIAIFLLTIFASTAAINDVTVLKLLFKLMGVNDVDPATCVGGVSAASLQLKNFEQEVKTKNLNEAVGSLSKAISSLSSSVSDCGVKEINLKLDALAAATKFAKITPAIDSAVDIIVGVSNVEKDIEALATAIANDDSDGVASGINQLLSDWTQVTGGCSADSKACQFVNGLLRVIQEVASDVKPCEAAVTTAVTSFETGASQFESADYKSAVASFSQGFDQLAVALKDQVCGLQRIGDLIGKLSPPLAAAVVQIEDSKAVHIIVGSADLYDDLYRAVRALKAGDWTTFGSECGAILRILRTSGCSTKACDVLEGVLASLQLELSDIDSCLSSVDTVWGDIQTSIGFFDDNQPVNGVKALGNTLFALSDSIKACQVPELASIVETMLNKMGDTTAATQIGDAVAILVNGADMSLEIQQAISDYKGKHYSSFGQDLSQLATAIGSSRCHSVGCQIIEGILNAAGVAFQDLEKCEKDIKAAEGGFVLGAQQFHLKQYKNAVQSMAGSLNVVARAVGDCGLKDELGYIIQEANVLGLANVTASWGNDMNILVHGADFYQLLYATVQDAEKHDWRAAGGDLQKVMSQTSSWTKKHACDSDFCYVVVGVFQFLGDIKGSVKECEADFQGAWADFGQAFANFSENSHSSWEVWKWSHDKSVVRAGVHALGDGMQLVSKGVGDCHVEEFADILARLAAKLGIVPEVSWIEEALHILINGVKIEEEVGNALVDWSNRNWPGFGYNAAMLTKSLL